MKTIIFLLLLLGAGGYALVPPESTAAQGTEWPQLKLTRLPFDVNAPVFLTHTGDGSGRLFIVEQSGAIRVVQNGQVLTTPFLDLSSQVIFQGEQGLLSLAFSPNYEATGEFYVNYTELSTEGDTYIVRYRVSPLNPNVADPASAEIILVIEQPYTNHNGGQLQFGHDGMLYIGMGDGGSGGDPHNYAQSPGELLGKMLRIEVEAGDPLTYTIPSDNPYVGQPGFREEIWQLGLRNPWRFSFDRLTHDMYIGDVGDGTWEEVNFQPGTGKGGENWGWRCFEGTHEFNFSECIKGFPYDMPVAEYDHSSGGCAVTGGYVYRGANSDRMNGVYLYTDYCSGTLWGLQNPGGTGWVNQGLGEAGFGHSSFGEDEQGALYLLNSYFGTVWRIDDVAHSVHLPLLQRNVPSPQIRTENRR